MKRALTESAEAPAPKKQRTRSQGALQEFYGFADVFRLSAFKLTVSSKSPFTLKLSSYKTWSFFVRNSNNKTSLKGRQKCF